MNVEDGVNPEISSSEEGDDDEYNDEYNDPSDMDDYANYDESTGLEGYENVFTIDEDDLGHNVDDLMTKHIKYKRRRCLNKCVLIISTILFLVSICVIGLKYFLSEEDREYYKEYIFSKLHVSNDIRFSVPPSDLNETCSTLSVSRNEGRDKCMRMCKVSECCFLPINDKKSCLETYGVECSLYFRYCKDMFNSSDVNSEDDVYGMINLDNSSSLEVEDVIPTAPENIGNICSLDSLKTSSGFMECEKLCSPGKCCYEFSQGCNSQAMVNCAGYSVCVNMAEVFDNKQIDDNDINQQQTSNNEINNKQIDDNDINQKLTSNNETDNKQIDDNDINQKLTSNNENDNKQIDDNDINQQQTSNNEITYSEFATSSSSDFSELQSYCGKEVIMISDNYDKCKSVCQKRSCCFHWGNDNCFDDQKEWCNEFILCYNLDLDVEEKEGIVDVDLVINEACSKLNVLTEAGNNRCDELCVEAACCFHDGPDNCYRERSSWCDRFKSCTNLDTDPALIVHEFCSIDKMSSGLDFLICSHLCVDRLCCFQKSSETNCYFEHKDWCDEFDSCYNINMSQVVTEYSPKTESNVISDLVPKVCNSTSESFERSNCEELCSERACCFLSGRDNCANDNLAWCNEFSACNILDFGHADNNNDNADESTSTISTIIDNNDNAGESTSTISTNIENNNDNVGESTSTINTSTDLSILQLNCGKDQIMLSDNYSKCREICQKRSCCFHWGKDNCFNDKYEWCNEFKDCNNIDWASIAEDVTVSIDDVRLDIDEICSELNVLTSAGASRCQGVCSSSAAKNCQNEKSVLCDLYESCSNLHVNPSSVVEKFCESDKLNTPLGYAVCVVFCTDRACCFQNGDGSCYPIRSDWCDEFKPCYNIGIEKLTSHYNEERDSDIVEKVCNTDALQSEGHVGLTDCEELCSERACCFFLGKESCYEGNEEWCDEFSICQKLNLTLSGKETLEPTNIVNPISPTLSQPLIGSQNNIQSTFPTVSKGTELSQALEPTNIVNLISPTLSQPLIESQNNIQSTFPTVSQGTDFSQALNDTCNNLNLLTDIGSYQCGELCVGTSCCFLHDADYCYYNKKSWCDLHQPCSKLLNPNLPKMVDEFCAKDKLASSALSNAICAILCSDRLCCFQEVDNCYQQQFNWCEEFKSCSNVEVESIASYYEVGENSNLVRRVCNDNALQSQGHVGLKACEELCSKRDCCFYDGRSSCYEENKEWCDEFSICKNLSTPTNFSPTISQGLDLTQNFPTSSQGLDLTQNNIESTISKTTSQLDLNEKDNENIISPTMSQGPDLTQNSIEKVISQATNQGKDLPIDSLKANENLNLTQNSSSYSEGQGLTQNSIDNNENILPLTEKQNLDSTQSIVVGTGETSPIIDVNVACSVESIKSSKDGHETCEKLCKERSCCFVIGNGSCLDSSKEWCEEYRSCQNLLFP